MAEIYLGIGSNIDAELHLRHALTQLRALEPSRIYGNPVVGSAAGSDFLNVVVRSQTALAPQVVREALRGVERTAARNRAGSPRAGCTLDIDLLLYGSLVDPLLRLPREDVLGQAYVLCPLVEIAPALRHPVCGMTMAEAWHSHRHASLEWTRSGRALATPLSADEGLIVKGESSSSMERPCV